MRRLSTLLAACLIAGGAYLTLTPTASASCHTLVGIGGFGDGQGQSLAAGVDRVAVYSGRLNAIEEGIAALDREVQAARAQGCEASISGYSQGAAIAHVWLQRNPGNTKAVLYADPKMAYTGESDGLFRLGGYPIAGTDAYFGGNPTVTLCYHADVVCNRGAGWIGYLFEGAHRNYDFTPRAHLGKQGQIRY